MSICFDNNQVIGCSLMCFDYCELFYLFCLCFSWDCQRIPSLAFSVESFLLSLFLLLHNWMHHGHHWTLGLFLLSDNIVHKVWILQCADKVTIGWCPRNLQTSVLRLSHKLVIHGFAVQLTKVSDAVV